MDPDNEFEKSQLYTLQDGTLVKTNLPSSVGRESATPPKGIIDQKFQIIELVGEGGMGAVYRARHLLLNKDVAFKTFKSGNLTVEDRKRFHREAQAIAKLNHKNIIQVFDCGLTENNIPYYTMEYLSGESMAQRLRRLGPLPVEQALPFFIQVCEGLALAHSKGVVHRDLKPGNLFIEDLSAKRSKTETIKIVDFGIASLTGLSSSGERITISGTIFGSPLYMSPEQAHGDKITESADIYSLGCSLFEVLTGRPPFHGSTPLDTILMHRSALPPTLQNAAPGREFSPGLERLISRMLGKTPGLRPKSMKEVGDHLTRELTLSGPIARSKAGLAAAGSLSEESETDGEAEGGDDFQDSPKKGVINAMIAAFAIVSVLVSAGAYYWMNGPGKVSNINGTVLSSTPISREAGGFAAGKLSSPAAEAPAAELLALGGVQDNSSEEKMVPAGPLKILRKTMTGKGNVKIISFVFPEGMDLGIFKEETVAKRSRKASGEVSWAADIPVIFLPSAAFLKHPDNLRIFEPDDLYGLDFRMAPGLAADPKVLSQEGRLTGLGYINLAHSGVDNKDIPTIARLTRLVSLNVDSTAITGGALACLPQLKQLNLLAFNDCKGAAQLLPALKGAKLRSLWLGNSPLTTQDFQLIGGLSNLEELYITGCHADDNAFAALAGLPHLKKIHCHHCVLTAAVLESIKKLRSQSLVNIDLGESQIPLSVALEIRKIVPVTIMPSDHAYDPPWRELGDHPAAQ